MTLLSHDDFRAIIDLTRLAPSVHNVQPSRWRMTHDSIELLGDRTRSIPVADPNWRDWRLSHGAAFEGLSISLARRGLAAELELSPQITTLSSTDPSFECIARARLVTAQHATHRLPVETRSSWRGAFKAIDADTNISLDRLASSCSDVNFIRERSDIQSLAVLADESGLHFLRDEDHRRELLAWLRLPRSHPNYTRDGLNADAMQLSPIEAWGAGLVLGPLFRPLDSIGLAATLTNERAKTNTAAAIALFHRPLGEDPFLSGRAFYRDWLAFEDAGLKGSPMSVLADWPVARNQLHKQFGLRADRHIVSVFRLGRPDGTPGVTRARLPVDELIV